MVLPVDDPRLAALADAATAAGKRVFRCSTTDRTADVCVVASPGGMGRSCVSVFVEGKLVGEELSVPTGVQPTNLACAVAVGLALDIEPAAHRRPAARSAGGRPPARGDGIRVGSGHPR